ncbi:MAG: tetratricopeptide repeat protein [bacterium]
MIKSAPRGTLLVSVAFALVLSGCATLTALSPFATPLERGKAKYEGGDLDGAVAEFKAVEGEEEKKEAANYLAQISKDMEQKGVELYLAGDKAGALALWEKILAFDEENKKVRFRVEVTRKELGLVPPETPKPEEPPPPKVQAAKPQAPPPAPKPAPQKRDSVAIAQESFNRGVDLQKKGNIDGAISEWKKVVDLETRGENTGKWGKAAKDNIAGIYNEKGDRALNAGDVASAIKNWRDALAFAPGNSEIEAKLQKAIQLSQKLIKSYFNQGLVYYENGNFKAAIEEFDKVLNLDPQNSQALEYKQKAKERQEKLEKIH